jgi:hypothetical protein
MIIKGVKCLCSIGNRPKDTQTSVKKCPVHGDVAMAANIKKWR